MSIVQKQVETRQNCRLGPRGENPVRRWVQSAIGLGVGMALTAGATGCAMFSKPLPTEESVVTHEAGTILSAATGQPITFDVLMDDLERVRLVYIGEKHTNSRHHEIQLDIIKALHQRGHPVAVGMEMFDRTYDRVLEKWTRGELDETGLLRQTHWYANWRYDYALYRPILEFVQSEQVPLIGLNLPFHLPAKISTGGLENLQPADRKLLPKDIDLSNEDHRAYVEEIFNKHTIRGRNNFDFFYEAQCAWDEAMAESIARGLDSEILIVIAGNGHIINKFGIPQRAYRRTQTPFRTVYLAKVGQDFELSYGDYIWITSGDKGKACPAS